MNKQQTTNGMLLASLASKLHIYNFLLRVGFAGFVHRVINRKLLKNSRLFFVKNRSRVGSVIDMLSDEKSKKVYESAVVYRQTRFFRDRPEKDENYQYFPCDIISVNDREVFIDCGAYIGDTIADFIKITHNTFLKIVAFEPDAENYAKLKQISIQDTRILPFCSGVWNVTGQLDFYAGTNAGSRVREVENILAMDTTPQVISIPVIAIDTIEECSDATFIKMDIEGSEMNALKGAIKTIIKNRPKLAICIYHSDEDMINIPEYLFSNLENYSFYVRHYSDSIMETVFYAIPK